MLKFVFTKIINEPTVHVAVYREHILVSGGFGYIMCVWIAYWNIKGDCVVKDCGRIVEHNIASTAGVCHVLEPTSPRINYLSHPSAKVIALIVSVWLLAVLMMCLQFLCVLCAIHGASGLHDAHLVSFGKTPVLSFQEGNTAYQQTFNPSFIQGSAHASCGSPSRVKG